MGYEDVHGHSHLITKPDGFAGSLRQAGGVGGAQLERCMDVADGVLLGPQLPFLVLRLPEACAGISVGTWQLSISFQQQPAIVFLHLHKPCSIDCGAAEASLGSQVSIAVLQLP